MNLYNPYFPFNSLQAQPYQALTSSPFLANSLMLSASHSLNQKRPFLYDSTTCVDQLDLSPLGSQKKFKADKDCASLLGKNQSRLNPIIEPGTKSKMINQNVITIDDDDETEESHLTNNSTNTNCLPSQVSLEIQNHLVNPLALLNFQKCFGINQYSPNAFSLSSSVLLNQLKQTHNQPFSQLLGYKDWNPSGINYPSRFEAMDGQTNLFEPLPAGLKNTPKPSKINEVVIIEDDEEDQSTCQASQTESETFSPCTYSQSQIQNITAIGASNNEIADAELKASESSSYAKIPPFQLSVLNNEKKKVRVLKKVWNPNNIESEKLEKWMEQISQAVGIEVTHEEKVLKTMMGFGMNIETALEKIKRNKAYYKNYFRTKNAGRNY